MDQFYQEHPIEESKGLDPSMEDKVIMAYKSSQRCQKVFDKVQDAFRRQYNNEEHYCGICMKNYLGEKFFFLSGCEHQFCKDCIVDMVNTNIALSDIYSIKCAEKDCQIQLTNLDINNLGLGNETLEKWDELSLRLAVQEMDDMGWCPAPACGALAHIDADKNQGQCTHCDFIFCLECEKRNHPFKRCWKNRIDYLEMLSEAERDGIEARNKRAEEILNELFFKYCSK